uniref:SET domain-containing protein n=1 Tax=Ditylum brightwellii TaxID=49249 RepID=A0A7S1ZT25_9STRA
MEQKRRLLMENANLKNSKQQDDNNDQKNEEDAVKHDASMDNNSPLPPSLDPWPSRPTLYRGPMAAIELVSSTVTTTTSAKPLSCKIVGGERGCIATQDIPAGTLLLIEEPIFTWPIEQIGKPLDLTSVYGIVMNENAQSIVLDLESLHPTKVQVDYAFSRTNNNDDDDEIIQIQIIDMIKMLQQDEGEKELLANILSTATKKKITNSNQTPLTSTDIYRILLTLRYNGFTSGIYLNFAMFNHDDSPNCIKYSPPPPPQLSTTNKEEKEFLYSEVRTTQFVKRGANLTLHYLEPREVSHCTKRRHLWDQHRFDIGDGKNSRKGSDVDVDAMYDLELVNGIFPPSSSFNKKDDDVDRPTLQVENTLSELEDLRQELQNRFNVFTPKDYDSNNEETVKVISQSWEYAKALELSADELCHTTIEKLSNPNHILVARCLRLHLEACDLLIQRTKTKMTSTATAKTSEFSLTESQQINVMCKFLSSAQTILQLQQRYLGNDHPDIARSHHDISQSIQYLLSKSPKQLLKLKFSGMATATNARTKTATFEQWSKEEYQCRKEYERISALYPRKDVEQIVKEAKEKKLG